MANVCLASMKLQKNYALDNSLGRALLLRACSPKVTGGGQLDPSMMVLGGDHGN
jgi:hypothetical protein